MLETKKGILIESYWPPYSNETWPRSYILLFETSRLQACIKLFRANNGNTTEMCEICSKLSIKTPERGYFDVLIAHFKNIRDLSSLTSLLTLNRFKTFCWCFTNRAGVNFKKNVNASTVRSKPDLNLVTFYFFAFKIYIPIKPFSTNVPLM